jgi:hypothetical protein
VYLIRSRIAACGELNRASTQAGLLQGPVTSDLLSQLDRDYQRDHLRMPRPPAVTESGGSPHDAGGSAGDSLS